MMTFSGGSIACSALFFSIVIVFSAIHITGFDQAEAATKPGKNVRKPWIIVSPAP